jgi:hypothetical protein
MIDNYYVFLDHWRVQGTVEEVAPVVYEGPGYTGWWPGVYMESKELVPGDGKMVGRVVEFYEHALLPMNIRWQAKVLESDWPHSMKIQAMGAFNGEGTWKLEQNGPDVDITLDWRVHTISPLEYYLSPVVRPVARLNHNYAMKQGEKSLQLELQRRRATTEVERAAVPAPPGPALTTRPIAGVGAAGLLVVVGAIVWRMLASRS